MIKIPYGHTHLSCQIQPQAVLCSEIDRMHSDKSGRQLVEEAMRNPIASLPLRELAKTRKNAVVIISDHTRPVPSKDIIPPILTELRDGNPNIDITLLVATGFHRGTKKEELIEKLGKDIVQQEKIVVHDAFSAENNVQIGTLPSGAPLVVDRVAAETELLVAEGFIEPHFFAGFSGGRKSVLPGICEKTTVLGNHCGAFIASDYARTGQLKNNPIHLDMIAAAKLARLEYIVNVIIDENKKTVAAFAGNFELAHYKGVEFLQKFCQVEAVSGEIVITSNGGAPLDQNIYQCVKGLTAAEACAKQNAVLIMCAELSDGTGGEGFYQSIKSCTSPADLFEKFKSTPQSKTIPDQWESQILARILMKHTVIFVTRPEMQTTIEEMKMRYAPSLDQAIKMAQSLTSPNALITLIPNGISVIIKSIGPKE